MEPIILPEPEKVGGKSLLEALQLRQTNRSISPKELPVQVLSNLLWSAFGVNRKKASFNKPGRTAPSASNSQEIDLYIALRDGIYIYEAIPHQLTAVSAGDFRMRFGRRVAATAETLKYRNPIITPIRDSLPRMFTFLRLQWDWLHGSTIVTGKIL